MLEALFANNFMPHGHCYFWRPGLLWTHVSADALIALAYFSIPVCLAYYLRQRPQLRFAWVVWLFAAFIVLCGITHVFGIITIWNPIYHVEAGVKLLCAAVSVITAAVLIPLVPRALTLRTADELEAMNRQLQSEVTARRRAEAELSDKVKELEQSNQELEQFAYIASHDLQSPLRSVVSFTGLLKRKLGEGADPDVAEYMHYIEDSGQHMQNLIRDLLDLSRVSTRAEPFRPLHAGEVVDAALKLLHSDIENTQAQVNVADLPEVKGDESQLIQVFQNLIANAIKFQPADAQPQVRIEAVAEGGDEGYWHFCVADNGIGIQPDQIEEMFTLFGRLQTDEAYDGTGIGLAICKKIVERHGGRIWAESAPGEGAAIHFTLPAHAQAQSQAEPATLDTHDLRIV